MQKRKYLRYSTDHKGHIIVEKNLTWSHNAWLKLKQSVPLSHAISFSVLIHMITAITNYNLADGSKC